MAIVDPILFIGDFYLTPFYVKSEKPINIAVPDDDVIIKGRIDTLVLKDQFWLMIIESKKASFSIEEGVAQILACMLGSPHPDKICFGMIATGSEFIFLTLPTAKSRGILGSSTFLAFAGVTTNRSRGNISPSVTSRMPSGRLCF
jgi:hypothetical protein